MLAAMAGSLTRLGVLADITAAARDDPRIAGVVDYGSSSEGRADEWSDVDVALFIHDADIDAFTLEWRTWASRFGPLLFGYTGKYGHPWAMYDTGDTGGTPLRVDYDFITASRIAALATWENSPVSVEAMVLYDGADGRITAAASKLVGKRTSPRDVYAAFESACGDFWYFLMYCDAKLRRGAEWNARAVFHSEVLDALFHILRIEAGGEALDHWNWKHNAFGIEGTLSAERLRQLNGCVPATGGHGLRRAMLIAATLGLDACASVAARERWGGRMSWVSGRSRHSSTRRGSQRACRGPDRKAGYDHPGGAVRCGRADQSRDRA
jgi:hypothetical protein